MKDGPFIEARAPKYRSLRTIGEQPMTTLLAVGIVNPMGPTLNALAVEGRTDSDRALPVLRLMLNPFMQEVTKIGVARLDRVNNLVAEMQPLLFPEFGSCPTLLVPSALLSSEDAVKLYSMLLSRFDDGLSVLQSVRRFPSDPWKRVKNEVAKSDTQPASAGSRRLTEDEATELATAQLAPKNLAAELSAFLFAWRGAIQFQTDAGSPLAKTALQFDDFVEVFARLAATCELPEPESPSPPS